MKFQIRESSASKIRKLPAATRVSGIFPVMRRHGNPRNESPDLQALPKITFRQLKIFRTVCREKPCATAAVESGTKCSHFSLGTTRIPRHSRGTRQGSFTPVKPRFSDAREKPSEPDAGHAAVGSRNRQQFPLPGRASSARPFSYLLTDNS
jgi:hypothetical protein